MSVLVFLLYERTHSVVREHTLYTRNAEAQLCQLSLRVVRRRLPARADRAGQPSPLEREQLAPLALRDRTMVVEIPVTICPRMVHRCDAATRRFDRVTHASSRERLSERSRAPSSTPTSPTVSRNAREEVKLLGHALLIRNTSSLGTPLSATPAATALSVP